jgi:UDP-N-acetylmuramate dehydrogenase
MKKNNLLEIFSKQIKSKLFFNYELKKTNWFNIGGKTKAYFKPDNLSDLVLFLKEFGHTEKIFVLGAGSNLLISENFFDGVIIKLGKNFSQISALPDKTIIAGSAASDKNLSEFASENNIGGLEFLYCIPGTIGGGLKMNSGCFDRDFKDIVVSVQAIDRSGRVLSIPSSEIKFNYRKSDLNPDFIFLSASFRGQNTKKNEVEKLMQTLKNKKNLTQPTKIKTGGSTFKNPINQTEKKVWKLIKESVPLDKTYGDAAISQKHCNFFINKKDARFVDMKKLIKFVKEKVKSKTGIELETEIEIIE